MAYFRGWFEDGFYTAFTKNFVYTISDAGDVREKSNRIGSDCFWVSWVGVKMAVNGVCDIPFFITIVLKTVAYMI